MVTIAVFNIFRLLLLLRECMKKTLAKLVDKQGLRRGFCYFWLAISIGISTTIKSFNSEVEAVACQFESLFAGDIAVQVHDLTKIQIIHVNL